MARIVVVLFMVVCFMSACGMNQSSDDYESRYENLDPTRNQSEVEDNDLSSKLGYVRYTRDDFKTETNHGDYRLNREQMANTITRSILQNEGFDEVATLVTGKEVLIAYQKNDSITVEKANDIAEKAAMSVTPRYFKIYVSDRADLMQDINSLHDSRTTNNNYQNTINNIIKEMNKSSE